MFESNRCWSKLTFTDAEATFPTSPATFQTFLPCHYISETVHPTIHMHAKIKKNQWKFQVSQEFSHDTKTFPMINDVMPTTLNMDTNRSFTTRNVMKLFIDDIFLWKDAAGAAVFHCNYLDWTKEWYACAMCIVTMLLSKGCFSHLHHQI